MERKNSQMMLGTRYANWKSVERNKQRVFEQFTETQVIEFARAGMMIDRIPVASRSLNVVGFVVLVRGYKQINVAVRSQPCLGVVPRDSPTLDEHRLDAGRPMQPENVFEVSFLLGRLNSVKTVSLKQLITGELFIRLRFS